jgi:CRISPR/Cas system Type II protein with McrA/HNH and RuvC-like nuclease domain
MKTNKKIAIWLKTNGKCFYCGVDTVLVMYGKNAYRTDHLIPLVRGGENTIENLVPCCNYCNGSKGSKTLEEFRFYKWQKQIEEKYGARFTKKQEQTLKKMGFEFPMPPYTFWFEEQNIEIKNYELEDYLKNT